MEDNLAYLEARLKRLGVDPKSYTFPVNPAKMPGESRVKELFNPYFNYDRDGNILIYFPDLTEAGVCYSVSDKGEPVFDALKRFKTVPEGFGKYKQEFKDINIFIPKNLLYKIKADLQFDTLYIIEGPFKAVAADLAGIDIVAMSGIHMYQEAKGIKRLHPTIIEIVKRCKVQTLVMVHDSDAVKIDYNPDDHEKDYHERLFSFYTSVDGFLKCVKTYNETTENPLDAYYMMGRDDAYKGLDDLFESLPLQHDAIKDDLYKLARARSYFAGYCLNSMSYLDIKRIFFLDLTIAGYPMSFYEQYQHLIENRPFCFDNAIYQANEKGKGLEIVYHKDLRNYIRVGTDYFKKIEKPWPVIGLDESNKITQLNVSREMVRPWTVSTIKLDFEGKRGIKKPLNYIANFDDFCNIPGHDVDFQPVVKNCYNMYRPTKIEPKKGEWETIKGFLEHISFNTGKSKYKILLDLLYLKYIKPMQRLPITVLFSPEKGTGKTQFLLLLNEIFGDNACFINSTLLKSQFNEYLLSSVVLLDEAVIDKVEFYEYLKSLSTLPEVTLNIKMKNLTKIPNFTFFCITTNKINFAPIESDENRYFILPVPVLKNREDPHILVKMKKELPAFLYYLRYEHVMTFEASQTRFWFPYQALKTKALDDAKFQSEQYIVYCIKNYLINHFLEFGSKVFYATPVLLAAELNKIDSSTKVSSSYVEKALKREFNFIGEPVRGRYKMLAWEKVQIFGQGEVSRIVKISSYTFGDKGSHYTRDLNGLYYTFHYDQWLNKDQIEQWKIVRSEIIEENEESIKYYSCLENNIDVLVSSDKL